MKIRSVLILFFFSLKECCASAAQDSEATFVDKHLSPVVKRVLLKGSTKDITYA